MNVVTFCFRRLTSPGRLSALELGRTRLGDYLETRVRNVIAESRTRTRDVGEISVRVLSARDRSIQTKEKIREYYSQLGRPIPDEFPYRSKAIFVFQQIEGQDICFFGSVLAAAFIISPDSFTPRFFFSPPPLSVLLLLSCSVRGPHF